MQADAAPSPSERYRQAADRVRKLVLQAKPETSFALPEKTAGETQGKVNGWISAGVQHLARYPEADPDNGYILGFDFGTSSSKIVVAQPFAAGDPSRALEVPEELRADAHPGAWVTALWINGKTGALSLLPAKDFQPVSGFKAGLIAGTENEIVDSESGLTRLEATVGYLAMMLAMVFGWYASERPLGEVGGDTRARINVGIPIESLDDKEALARFNRAIAAARRLVGDAETLTVEDVRSALLEGQGGVDAEWQLVPELLACIAGFAADPKNPPGAHYLIDIGAATLDIAAFNLLNEWHGMGDHGGLKKVSVFAAKVEPFGAEAAKWALAGGATDKDVVDACHHAFECVDNIATSEKGDPKKFRLDERTRHGTRIVLLGTGGGLANPLYTRFLETKVSYCGVTRLEKPNPPARIMAGGDIARLLLAYGLSRDPLLYPELSLPSQITAIEPQPTVHVIEAPGPEQM